jgi:hypothetical protein
MGKSKLIIFPILLFFVTSTTFAQRGESKLKIFGYFQNSFQHWTTFEERQEHNSFSLQQLNLFFQKDLGQRWTAFINFEFLNNFSSSRQWGSANLEEAWIAYRANMKFKLKLGLQIPTFNNLNEIKNRTPLLPYIIRPLVYETSFSEFIATEEFLPARAFVQAYGFLPTHEVKFDYAAYLGNSSNINNNQLHGQTGIDTTITFLIGGRLGIRYRELKVGFSGTYEKKNDFMGLADTLGRQPSELKGMPKTRFGGDLSYHFANFSFESEFIIFDVDEGIPELELDLAFYYATLGYHFTEQLYVYGSYWIMEAHQAFLSPDNEKIEDGNILTPNIGVSLNIHERIRLKGQFARVKNNEEYHFITQDEVRKEEENFSVYAVAVSVFF